MDNAEERIGEFEPKSMKIIQTEAEQEKQFKNKRELQTPVSSIQLCNWIPQIRGETENRI